MLSDKLGFWIRERCTNGGSTPLKAAFDDYKQWSEEIGEQAGGMRAFVHELAALGVERRHTRGGSEFIGFGLKSDPPELQTEPRYLQ
jgi:hypothetical protein